MDAPRIRVLATAFAAVPGSSPHSAALLAMAASVRAEVDLVTIKTEALSHVERLGDARMFRVPVGEARPLEARVVFDRAVGRQLEAERYDVVHVRGPFEGMLAAERKSAYGYQLVYEMATFPDEALGAEVERRWAEAHARCVADADLLLVPTEAARRAVGESLPPERVVVLPPGVDVGAYDWRPQTPSAVPRLLYLGSFTADRDLSTVLEAIRRVSTARPVRVLMAGETDRSRRDRLRRMVDAFGLTAVVEIRGEPASRTLPQIIAGADLCLAPASEVPRFQSLGDLPQPLLEYLACHRPVVAAGVPGVVDVLRDEHEGLLYAPGDEGGLTDAILEMLRDQSLRERTTESGYRRVRESFSSGARRRRIAEVYERLVPGSQGTDPWADSFEDPATGEAEVVSSISGVVMETSSNDTIAPASDETHDPEHVTHSFEFDTGEQPAPSTFPGLEISPSTSPVDTDPGSLMPSEALVSEKTRPRSTDTDPGA